MGVHPDGFVLGVGPCERAIEEVGSVRTAHVGAATDTVELIVEISESGMAGVGESSVGVLIDPLSSGGGAVFPTALCVEYGVAEAGCSSDATASGTHAPAEVAASFG